MGLSVAVKQKIYEALPSSYLQAGGFLDGKYVPIGKSHKDRAAWWARQSDAVLMFALNPDEIQLDLKTIKELARILKVRLDPEDDEYPEDQQLVVYDEATRFVQASDYNKLLLDDVECTQDAAADEPIGTEQLWEESARIAQTVLLLTARKSKTTTQRPVAVWNSRLSSRSEPGVWVRIDLRRHPVTKLRREGVLSVLVDHQRSQSKATFEKGVRLAPQKHEKELFGKEGVDYPEGGVLAQRASKRMQDAIKKSPVALRNYDDEWWEEVNPRDQWSGSNIYAQLGGWPISWPEQSSDELMTSSLVLRTYQDSEPWIEVFRTGRRYEVFERIT